MRWCFLRSMIIIVSVVSSNSGAKWTASLYKGEPRDRDGTVTWDRDGTVIGLPLMQT